MQSPKSKDEVRIFQIKKSPLTNHCWKKYRRIHFIIRKELNLEERIGVQEAMVSKTIGKHMVNLNHCLIANQTK